MINDTKSRGMPYISLFSQKTVFQGNFLIVNFFIRFAALRRGPLYHPNPYQLATDIMSLKIHLPCISYHQTFSRLSKLQKKAISGGDPINTYFFACMLFRAFFLLNKAKSLLGTRSALLFFNSFNEDDFPLSTFLFYVFPEQFDWSACCEAEYCWYNDKG